MMDRKDGIDLLEKFLRINDIQYSPNITDFSKNINIGLDTINISICNTKYHRRTKSSYNYMYGWITTEYKKPLSSGRYKIYDVKLNGTSIVKPENVVRISANHYLSTLSISKDKKDKLHKLINNKLYVNRMKGYKILMNEQY